MGPHGPRRAAHVARHDVIGAPDVQFRSTLPPRQKAHAVAPKPENLPVMHCAQLAGLGAPEALEKVPGEQIAQVDATGCPRPVE